MLSQRLDRLESDLQVLNAMQDLFLQYELGQDDSENASIPSSGRSSINPALLLLNQVPQIEPDHIPERDVKSKNHSHSQKQSKQSSTSTSKSSESSGKAKYLNSSKTIKENRHEHKRVNSEAPRICHQNLTQVVINEVSHANQNQDEAQYPTSTEYLTDMESTAVKLTDDLEKERQVLKEDVERERRLRAEVEESAKHVYIKMQKVEDELEREKKTKEALLLGTLQLKNLIHGYDSKVKESNEDLAVSKAEIQRLSTEVQELATDNGKILKRLKHLCNELGYRRAAEFPSFGEEDDKIHKDSSSSTPYLEFFKRRIQELTRKVTGEESDKVGKLTSELSSALGRSEKLEKEGQETSNKLQQCLNREEHLKQQLHMSQLSLSTVESELLKKQIEHECILQKLRSDSQIEKDMSAVKSSECTSVIRRTKELLMTLRNERDKCRKELHEANSQNHGLRNRLKILEAEKHGLMKEVQKVTKMIGELSKEKLDLEVGFRNEKFRLETSLQKTVLGRRKCMELLSEMKSQLVHVKNKYRHESAMLQVEKGKLLTENKRLDENFRVLQKVSEDQGQTIHKLRGDLDKVKNSNFKLESQVRDHECTETQLVQKLEHCEKKIEAYIRHIENLEDKVDRYEEDVRTHDCDDYADSRYKRKLNEIEESFRRKNKDWEETLRDIEKERDEALQTAKRTLQKVDELREHQTSQLAQVKAQFQAEMKRLVESHNQQDMEKHRKIQELQSELDRAKLSSSQIQRALSTKLQQLQAALNICIGGGGGSTQNNNSSLGLLHHHHHPQLYQHHHPVAALGNNVGAFGASFGSVNNNAQPANHNGAPSTSTNLLLNSTAGSGCCDQGGGAPQQNQNHQTLTTCFGGNSNNSTNVNGFSCTSAILREPYPSTGSFDVDVGLGSIDNLIL